MNKLVIFFAGARQNGGSLAGHHLFIRRDLFREPPLRLTSWRHAMGDLWVRPLPPVSQLLPFDSRTVLEKKKVDVAFKCLNA